MVFKPVQSVPLQCWLYNRPTRASKIGQIMGGWLVPQLIDSVFSDFSNLISYELMIFYAVSNPV